MSITKAELITENARLRKRVALLERARRRRTAGSAQSRRLQTELAEALEQQTATSEILRVISSSPTDIQPVLDTVAASAARLCESFDADIWRREGDQLVLVAHYGPIPVGPVGEAGLSVARGTVGGRSVLDGRPVQVADLQAAAEEFPESNENARHMGFRTTLSVPLVREGVAIGAVILRRTEIRPFTDRQVALLQTFADQAVIAIENVRLFTELEARNRDLTTALDRQTATSEILQVISRSPTEVQPVFETIVRNAVRLCGGVHGGVYRFDGQLVHSVAHDGYTPEELESWRKTWPRPVTAASAACQAIRTKRLVRIADIETAPELSDLSPEARANVRARGSRGLVGVPIRRQDDVIGAIAVTHGQIDGFSDAHLELLKTFADQAVIAIENVRLFKELEGRNRDLTEALEQQTATADILRVISASPTEVQPVFEIIAERAMKLCEAEVGVVSRLDGELIHLAAIHGWTPEDTEAVRRAHPMLLNAESVTARTMRNRAVVHIQDVLADPLYEHRALALKDAALAARYRLALGVPMVREGQVIGAIFVARAAPGQFSDRQVALLKTFADQAVIAIENVRLFKELQEKNRALTDANAQVTEALDQQTATSDILRVISSSPTDEQPVFDAIVESARRLCEATFSVVFLTEAGQLTLAAVRGVDSPGIAALQQAYPRPVARDTASGRAVLDQRVVHIQDTRLDPDYTYPFRDALALRSLLSVPIFRAERPIGAISVWRGEARPFTDKQIALLQTFADQAVIAIENVRLFTELQASNSELTTALDTQTATSEILRVISRSQTDVQPVFDAIVTSAVRLLQGYAGALTRIAGDQIELAALTITDDAGNAAVKAIFPQSLQSEWPIPQAIRNLAPLNIADFQTDPRWPEAARALRVRGYRSLVVVPMLRHNEAVGAISVTRREPGGFTDDDIALLKTFADQAVIAIENARLLSELQARTQELTRSVGELRALGEVGQAISSTLDLRTVLSTIVARATQLSDTDAGVIYEYDEQREVFMPRATEHLEAEIVETMLATPVRKGEGATGRLAEIQEPIQVPDILAAPAESRVRGALVRAGYRALLAVPLVREGHLLGGLTVIRKATGAFPPEVVDVLKTFATQSALAIQNARLFHEIADKSRQLEAASRHKSEFLANMSHELRTPLNAIIGFSEVLMQRMFGELNAKQEEYLRDIYDSGRHLLSLINDILDLSKIEAGRMELELTDFDLPTAIDSALTLVRERATRRGIALQKTLDERVGPVQADERKVRQVVLNLLSNAIKFTPEGGRIEVRAVPVDGSVEVSVTDTGVGIAPEDQEAVFEEFRQVGASAAKQEGTGLGLALCRKFVELHGGTIWVTSAVGAGSTFTFRLPVRPWPAS